jgi:hypothetical protein
MRSPVQQASDKANIPKLGVTFPPCCIDIKAGIQVRIVGNEEVDPNAFGNRRGVCSGGCCLSLQRRVWEHLGFNQVLMGKCTQPARYQDTNA